MAVYKKGPRLVASNQKAICVMGPLPKLFMSCLNVRVSSISEQNGWRAPPQAGFCPQHRREDLIVALDYLVDRSHATHSLLAICYVDLEKAFDSIP